MDERDTHSPALKHVFESWHRHQRVHAYLERILSSHKKLLATIERTQPALLDHPLPDLAAIPPTLFLGEKPPQVPDLPIDRTTEQRFAGLALDAQLMVDRWEDLAEHYNGLAKLIRDSLGEDDTQAETVKTLRSE